MATTKKYLVKLWKDGKIIDTASVSNLVQAKKQQQAFTRKYRIPERVSHNIQATVSKL